MEHTPLIAKETGGTDFKIIEPGNYVARCYSVVDLGTTHNPRFNVDSRKVRISFEMPTELETFKEEKWPEPFAVSKEYTLSLSEKANLRWDLENWRGKKFTQEELEGFDLYNILGKTCMVQIIHKPSKDGTKTYAEISGIATIPKGLECPEQINATTWFNLNDFQEDVYNGLSEYLKKRIAESNEYETIQTQMYGLSEPTKEITIEDVPFA